MYLGIISLPLIGFFLVGLGGRYYGRVVSAFLTTILIFISFLISLFIWYEVSLSCAPVSLHLYTWLEFHNVTIKIGFLFDFITCVMLIVITGISFCVHLYSIGYLSNDPHLTRFMAYLSLFTFWMLILVSADNFLQMFIGWEGVGLCSYLLINFWFTRIKLIKRLWKQLL
jgi:NADH:ubiquinone oxidoreductase subunit 5 (subunit L)/multisubunit Na+/H+ antiporter MnhA subunit